MDIPVPGPQLLFLIYAVNPRNIFTMSDGAVYRQFPNGFSISFSPNQNVLAIFRNDP